MPNEVQIQNIQLENVSFYLHTCIEYLFMEEHTRKIALIDTILGDEGLLRYTAIKNRFASEEAEHAPENNFLEIYVANTSSIENSTIFSYKENLHKLRRKIEDHRVKIVQTISNGTDISIPSPSITLIDSVVIDSTVADADTDKNIVSPEKENTPSEILQPAQNISLLSSLESFQRSSATGHAQMIYNRKIRTVSLLLENTILKSSFVSPKPEESFEILTDITSSSLFLFIVPPKKFFSCFSPQPVRVPILKETAIVNITKASSSTYEIILKNTNTGSFEKEITKVLSFSLLDLYNREHRYTISDISNYIKWLLAMKVRMHAADSWDKKDFLESLRK